MFATEDLKLATIQLTRENWLEKTQFFDGAFQFFEVLSTNRVGVPGIWPESGHFYLQNGNFYVHTF